MLTSSLLILAVSPAPIATASNGNARACTMHLPDPTIVVLCAYHCRNPLHFFVMIGRKSDGMIVLAFLSYFVNI